MRITTTMLREMVAFGRERPDVEFKASGSSRVKRFRAKIIKAMIAMSNRRGGGVIVIGVSEAEGGKPTFTGVDKEDRESWASQDNWADQVRTHADPPVIFDLQILEMDQKFFVVISVDESVDPPVCCRKSIVEDQQVNFEGKKQRPISFLEEGKIYARSQHKAETVVAGYYETREIVRMAVERQIQSFRNLKSVEARIDGNGAARRNRAIEMLRDGPLWVENELLRRGHWRLGLSLMIGGRSLEINYDRLEEVVQQASVPGAGWSFPLFVPREITRKADAIQCYTELGYHLEAWQFDTMGFFCFLGAFKIDWEARPGLHAYRHPTKPNTRIHVYDTVRFFVQAFAFALRAIAISGADSGELKMTIDNLRNRVLYISPDRPFLEQRFDIEKYSFEQYFSKSESELDVEENALLAAREFFLRADWRAEMKTLRGIRDDLR